MMGSVGKPRGVKRQEAGDTWVSVGKEWMSLVSRLKSGHLLNFSISGIWGP